MEDKNKLRINYNNKVYDVSAIDFSNSRGQIVSLDRMETLMCRINLDNLIHCMGFKDKHNKLIYVGDIVKEKWFSEDSEQYEECLYVAEFSQEHCAYCLTEVSNGYKNFFIDLEYIPEDYEIIGNIYENPDLLVA